MADEFQASLSQNAADRGPSPEKKQEGNSSDRVGDDHREVDQPLHQPATGEAPTRQEIGQWDTEQSGEESGPRGRNYRQEDRRPQLRVSQGLGQAGGGGFPQEPE
jgi:hypothetical protein